MTEIAQHRRKDVSATVRGAKRLVRHRTKWAIYTTAAFLLSCASVVPFFRGFPLHAYWESFGKFFLLLSMSLLLPFVFFAGRAINAWFFVREVEKIDE